MMTRSSVGEGRAATSRRGDALRLLAGWLLVVASVIGVGLLLTGPLRASVGSFDNDVERALAHDRTGSLTGVAQALSLLGETVTQLVLVPVLLALVWWRLRSARPVVFLTVAAVGEVAAYLVVVNVVSRRRPPVHVLDPGLDPRHSFPSGHVAAAAATYGGLAVLLWCYAHGPWRRLGLALLVLPLTVAVARLYLGAHHPTDVLTSLLAMTAWLFVGRSVLLDRPGSGRRRVRRSRPAAAGQHRPR